MLVDEKKVDPARPLTSVAVLEAVGSAQTRASEILSALGLQVVQLTGREAIATSLFDTDCPELLLVALPEEQELLERVKSAPRPPLVIASLAGPAASALERLGAMDKVALYAVRPHSIESLGPIVQAATTLFQAQKEISALQSQRERLKEQIRQAGKSTRVTGFQSFEFFKRLLVLEIKRAKRYEYSVAVCLVEADTSLDGKLSEKHLSFLNEKIASAVTSSIRDIDIPVDYAENRMLLFLPYTDMEGAKGVGERIRRLVATSTIAEQDEDEAALTVSVGIAALGKDQGLSFARLMKEANAALDKAREKGGDTVVAATAL